MGLFDEGIIGSDLSLDVLMMIGSLSKEGVKRIKQIADEANKTSKKMEDIASASDEVLMIAIRDMDPEKRARLVKALLLSNSKDAKREESEKEIQDVHEVQRSDSLGSLNSISYENCTYVPIDLLQPNIWHDSISDVDHALHDAKDGDRSFFYYLLNQVKEKGHAYLETYSRYARNLKDDDDDGDLC